MVQTNNLSIPMHDLSFTQTSRACNSPLSQGNINVSSIPVLPCSNRKLKIHGYVIDSVAYFKQFLKQITIFEKPVVLYTQKNSTEL